jgi:outer membrane protein
VRLVQPLLRAGGWTAATSALRDARLGARAADAALRARVLQLVFDVKAAYLEILRRRQLIEVNRRAVARDEDLVAFSRAKVEAQLATTRDVLSAEIVLAQDRGRLVNATAQYQAGLDQLANVLAVRIARPLELETIDLAMPAIQVDEDAWVARALRENPGLEQARLDLERAELARKLAGNARLPQLDLSVAYDQVRESISGRVSERTWEGTVTMSYPLLPRGPAGAYRQARLEYDQSRRLLADAERLVVLDVRDAVRNLQRSQDRISILEKNIEGARAKVEFAKVNFQLGRASNLDITDAQKDLLTAETDHVNELVTYRLGVARLEQLLGGSI